MVLKKILLISLLSSVTSTADNSSPKPLNETNIPAKKPDSAPRPEEEDEISLVIKGKIISVTEKEIIYKETGSATEGRAPIHNLHFLRRASGEYRFFTPAKTELRNPTQVAIEEVKPKERPADEPVAQREFVITAGGIVHLARNTESAEYITGLSAYLARSKGSTGELTGDAAKMQFQGFIEPRIAYKQFMVGLNVGYAAFPKITGTVNSTSTTSTQTLSLNGYMIPALAIFYYRMPLAKNLSLHLGLGGGAMYTSIKYSEEDAVNSASQRYTAWTAVAIAKPEVSYQFGRLSLMVSVPFYFAESRKVESGSTALINGDTGKVISPNLTGISFSFAVGYQL